MSTPSEQMINDISLSYFQTELVAVLTVLFFAFMFWINRDKNNKFEETTIKLFAFLALGLTVVVTIYAVYVLVGG